MQRIRGFPAIEESSARLLILGSMPGQRSLDAKQYYAHPRNAFWQIMGELFGAGTELVYQARIDKLKARGVAIWDVLKYCRRQGSLDSAITKTSMVSNNFQDFFKMHPDVKHVYFNGMKAEQVYSKLVRPVVIKNYPDLVYRRLPSTSPAHASKSLSEKIRAWGAIVIK